MLGWAQLFPAWSSTPWPPYSPSPFSSVQPFRQTLLAPLLPSLPSYSDQQKADSSWAVNVKIFWSRYLRNAKFKDLGCLSLILILYPSRIPDLGSWIPDPSTAAREKGESNLLSYLFCSHKYKKKLFNLQTGKEKNLGQLTKNCQTFSQKIGIKLSNMGLGSEIRDPKNLFRIPNPEVKKEPNPGSWSVTLIFCTNLIWEPQASRGFDI